MMLIDHHPFVYHASVPWPRLGIDKDQIDWIQAINDIEHWLVDHVGHRLQTWAWNDSNAGSMIGVGFRWDQHRLLFVLTWS